ncbi:MAG: methyltransferase domain-containing protein [Ilumatobacteraceae bacterium]|nr:methyltransferase domain-containing protein [Ilumatobacteraceae bacterium]
MPESGPSARAVAVDVLERIDDGAFANAVLGTALERSGLDTNDRRFVTDLVYGVTRMRRACDAITDRFVSVDPDAATRRLLRLGAYQLAYAGVAAYAAVSETVELAPRRTRGFVNAVLRRVAAEPMPAASWPSDAARLSYPDWIVDRLRSELGEDDADATLEVMNRPPPVTERSDGYVQDLASTWVAEAVDAGGRVLDLCAAPGGKASALATDAHVVATDVHPGRVRMMARNAARRGVEMPVAVVDGRQPPFAPATFDAVLLDAPCSGLGALRRRPDARWRITPTSVDELVELQAALLDAAATLVRPGGQLVYSVCTLTAAESIDHAVPRHFAIDNRAPDSGTWRPYDRGWRVLPHDADTDGMTLLRYRRVDG